MAVEPADDVLPILSSLPVTVPAAIRIGHWQVPAFGLVTTLGIVAALFVSQRTAPLARVDPSQLWDAGVAAVLCAFAISRALLVAINLRTFLQRPMLVLAQPSLTLAGLVLTALFVWIWLRRRHLPPRQVADAWAVPGVLLATALQVAHFTEGTGLGMPTKLPWGVIPRNGHAIHLHPVQLYGAAAYLALGGFLLLRQRREGPRAPGAIAGLALVGGGVITFFLGFLRLPYDLLGNDWLDPGQWMGVFAILGGTAFLLPASSSTPNTHLQERTNAQQEHAA